MSNKKNVIIIGSGLGGLSCGVILAKNGYHVIVLEQENQIGGCLQCFTRKGGKFETGMHFIGSAAQGQTLQKLMRYLEVDGKVCLSQLDTDGYDVVALDGKQYRFPNGREAFIRQMTEYFPHQHDNLVRYCDLVRSVASASSLHSLKYAESDSAVSTEYLLRSIDGVIDEVITDPTLAKVLVGNLPLYAAEKRKTPFSTHAFIVDFYNQSAFRFVGGSDTLANALADTIRRYGGEVLTRKKVSHILCDDTHAVAVEVNGAMSGKTEAKKNTECFACDYVISDAHPVRTLELLDTKLIRPAFRKRVQEIPQTVGCFAVYVKFKEGEVPYMNYNYYGYQGDTPWGCEKYTEETWPKGFLYMHFCDSVNHDMGNMVDSQRTPIPKFASTGVVLSYMQMEDVEQWKGTYTGRRGLDYEDFKHRKAEKILAVLEKHFPGVRDKIEAYYTSTPLTYLDYTGTEDGSMYGNAKDIAMGAAGRVAQRTKVPNVYLTGQNINSHGMLGVMVGTIVTCSEFLTAQKIYEQINKANEQGDKCNVNR